MFGSYRALGYAESMVKSEALRGETAFLTHVRGRQVYGAKVLRPKEIGYAILTEAAETTI
jgi:hypothetical protein